jgi:nitrogen fixation/metabolism regulation signal transduction histidine kinase
VDKTNRRLSRFLQAIRHADFSQSFTGLGLGSSFRELNESFAEVIKDFQQIREEKEEHYRYLQTVVEHVGIGLIAFNKNGEVELINRAAKRLLRVPRLRNISSLKSLSRDLVKTLSKLKAGGRSLVKVHDGNDFLQLAIYSTEFRLRNQMITLVSLQNIQSELEEKEMEAWQKLIRVLTHEIMNSVTPISSLASTVNELLLDIDPNSNHLKESEEQLQDVRDAVHTIQRRSEGLLRFVESYRSLTRLPNPKFKTFKINGLFERVRKLLENQIKEENIKFDIFIKPESLELIADSELIEQVLINLLKNGVEAVSAKEDGSIELKGFMDEYGRVFIQVIDNGIGINKEAREKIFIPFFTTKKSGSGIGLSLSRQIMRLHKGNISVSSEPNQGSCFTLRF